MKIYLAGGMKSGWQGVVKERAPKHDYYDPCVDTDGRYGFRIAQQDFDGVDWADMVFAYFEMDNPSGVGLALEVGYAVAKGKRVVVVDEHDRLHEFLAGCGRPLFTSFNEAVRYLDGISTA